MRVMETSAMPSCLRSRVPAKMTSSILPPRKVLALCSPNTQLTPSRMLDLPQPFGPTTTAIPWPGRETSVRSQKDLKPRIWIFLSFSMRNYSLTSRAGTQAKIALDAWCFKENFRLDREPGQHKHPNILWISSSQLNPWGGNARMGRNRTFFQDKLKSRSWLTHAVGCRGESPSMRLFAGSAVDKPNDGEKGTWKGTA